MTRILFVNLLSSRFQLGSFIFCPSWMVSIVVLNPTMAIETESNRVVDIVRTARSLGVDMMNLNIYATVLFA